MINIIMGTAGHIDHGKTSLIRALTGIDCDTHPQEKSRGITINLGFAHLEFEDDESMGIVDVPGHAAFIDTMVAGASGINLVMLVVAADEGVMPQTIEHLRILQCLGVSTGIIVLTKTDLVDDEILTLAESEIKKLVKNTFLERSKIVSVSAETGKGIEELKTHLWEMKKSCKIHDSSGFFRMFVDRIFTVKGFGTVVTGSTLSGSLRRDDEVLLLPVEKKVRIRRMERHGHEVEKITAGNRVSLNLVGINKEEFIRGMVIADKMIDASDMIDAKLVLFNVKKKLGIWTHVIFLSGTVRSRARIHLIDKNELGSEEKAIVQIHLSEKFILLKGDKFIIRNSSDNQTLGGGEIIDVYPLHHRRRPEDLVRLLHNLADGDIAEYIATLVKKSDLPLPISQFGETLNITEKKLREKIIPLLSEDICLVDDGNYLIRSRRKNNIKEKILKKMTSYHNQNPLDDCGKKLEDYCRLIDIIQSENNKRKLTVLLDEFSKERELKKVGNTWALFYHKVSLSEKDRKQIKFIADYFNNSGMHVPVMKELINDADRMGISEEKLNQILRYLVAKNRLIRIEENFVLGDIVEKSKKTVLGFLKNNDKITVAEFRDLIYGNRKICLLMLNYFDREGLTMREGDYRFITDKGLKHLSEL